MEKLATSIFLMTLGLILAGYAILMPMLKVIGTRTTGIVTDVRRQGGERNEMTRNLYNYGVGFYFVLPEGQKIQGGEQLLSANPIAQGSRRGLSLSCISKASQEFMRLKNPPDFQLEI